MTGTIENICMKTTEKLMENKKHRQLFVFVIIAIDYISSKKYVECLDTN